MNSNTSKALRAAHSPVARGKAVASLMKLAHIRSRLGKQYGLSSNAFTKGKLLQTCRQHGIELKDIPTDLFKPFPRLERNRLLGLRAANGHDKSAGAGVGIPLEAIPERKKAAANGERAAWGSKAKTKAHPNAELIAKIVDTLGRPETKDKVADRLLSVLDRLIGP